MRKWTFIPAALITALALNSASAQTSLFARSYALVVGIDAYESEVWPDLPYAVDDAEGMATYLRNQGFQVKLLPNEEATKNAIISWLEDHLAPQLTENDRFLFFFSGHGETKPYADEDHGYIIPHKGTNRPSSWISMEKMRELSRKLGAARHQLFIFDACFGGLFATKSSLSSIDPSIPNYVSRVSSQKARQYLTAGGKGERVRAEGPKGYSYFTGYLLEALEQGKGDTYPDGYITASELAAYLTQAADNPDHTPRGGTISGHEQGEFLFRSPLPASVRVGTPTVEKPIVFKGRLPAVLRVPMDEEFTLKHMEIILATIKDTVGEDWQHIFEKIIIQQEKTLRDNVYILKEGENTYIRYDPSFIEKLRHVTQTNWSVIGVIAYMLGHHYYGHMKSPVRTLKEAQAEVLQADEWTGFILAKFGANLQEAQSFYQLMPIEQRNTHPSKERRLWAFQRGWKRGTR